MYEKSALITCSCIGVALIISYYKENRRRAVCVHQAHGDTTGRIANKSIATEKTHTKSRALKLGSESSERRVMRDQ